VLTGGILAGGQSRRYGRNKALEVYQGARLIDRGVHALRSFCDPVLLVANDISLYYDVKATLVRDVLSQQGPVGGIHTALLFSPNDWVFVRAGDMPFLKQELADMMLGLKEGVDAVVPICSNGYEPLCAMYHRRCLAPIATILDGKDRKIVSFYRKIRIRYLAEEEWRTVDPEGLSFKNINTPDDLVELYGAG